MNILSYCNKKIDERADFIREVEFHVQFGVEKFSDLMPSDKCKVVGLLIAAIDVFFDTEWFIENNHLDVMVARFSKMLISLTDEDEQSFIRSIRRNAISYYEKQLDQFFAEKVEERAIALAEATPDDL